MNYITIEHEVDIDDIFSQLAVRKEFKKVYGLTKLNNRLKWINYILED